LPALLKLRWTIRQHVDMRPTLKFYSSWEGQRGARDALWGAAASKMERDLARKDPRDF
jgi:hypothetical protein